MKFSRCLSDSFVRQPENGNFAAINSSESMDFFSIFVNALKLGC